MKTRKSTFNLLVDFVLLSGFLVLFYLEFTGINVHQWLGVALGGLALFHLILHWRWVTAVMKNFKKPAGRKVGLFFSLDVAILFGLVSILVSGLAISTWFSIALADPGAWVDLHISLSIMTLVLIVIKIGLHWQWIVKKFSQAISLSRPLAVQPVPVSTQIDRQRISRRQFLTMMGVVTLASYLAIHNVLKDESPSVANASYSGTDEGQETVADSSVTAEVLPSTDSNTSADIVVEEIQPSNTSMPTSQPTSSDTQTQATLSVDTSSLDSSSQQSGSQSPETCFVRCNRRCSYPGQCRRYIDTNSNGKCDLGECV